MPFYRSWFATRAEAEAAAASAIANVEAIYTATNESDVVVAAGLVPASAAPTAHFEYVSEEAASPLALPTGAVDMRRVRVRVVTADGAQAFTWIWMTVTDVDGDGGDDAGFRAITLTDGGEYHAVGAALEWNTRVGPAPDGRWFVELFSLPEGT